MSGPQNLTDLTDLDFSTVPVMFGTPPQEVDMTVNTYSSLLAAFAYDCTLCAGSTFLDPTQSSTFGVRSFLLFHYVTTNKIMWLFFPKSSNRSWASSSPDLTGNYFQDSVGFGGGLTLDHADFGMSLMTVLIWFYSSTYRSSHQQYGVKHDSSSTEREYWGICLQCK